MQTITITLDDSRMGRASGFLGGLTMERYRFVGRDVPEGTRVAVLSPVGDTLAAATSAADTDGPYADLDTDTQPVADLLRYQPVGRETPVYVAIGDADDILAIVHARMRKNWLDDGAVHPPAPLPEYWTAQQVQEALATRSPQLVAGDNVSLEPQEDGTIKVSATGGLGELPIASASILGGVKVGAGLSAEEDGTLSGSYLEDADLKTWPARLDMTCMSKFGIGVGPDGVHLFGVDLSDPLAPKINTANVGVIFASKDYVDNKSVTVDTQIPTSRYSPADPTHAASMPLLMTRLVGAVQPSITESGTTGTPVTTTGHSYYRTIAGLFYCSNAENNEIQLGGVCAYCALGTDTYGRLYLKTSYPLVAQSGGLELRYGKGLAARDHYLCFCGELLGGACCALTIGYGASATYDPNHYAYNVAIGNHTSVGPVEGLSESPTSAFLLGNGAYSNLCSSLTLAASDAAFTRSLQMTLVTDAPLSRPNNGLAGGCYGRGWIGFRFSDALGDTCAVRVPFFDFVEMLKTYAHGEPWAMTDLCSYGTCCSI